MNLIKMNIITDAVVYMKNLTTVATTITIVPLLVLFGCNDSNSPTRIQPTGRTGDNQYNPTIDPEDFVAVINNPFYTLIPGFIFTYQGATNKGIKKNIVMVRNETNNI
jgi:hypothetical protein